MMHSRPKITDSIVDDIRRLISDNPDWNRSKLSIALCEIWGWRNENGQVCDISCRDMLRALDLSGKITLPPPERVSRRKGSAKIIHAEHDTTPVTLPLSDLRPLHVEVAASKADIMTFKSYMDQYHYLGYDRLIGENIKYAVYSRTGTPLASLMFGSSAWACKPRDTYIGWDRAQRQAGLRYTTNNQRFLIYPWVKVKHLASHVLGLVGRRISKDWIAKYGHGLHLLETFVECDRFRGVSYQASNWVCVGQTTGRGRDSTSNRAVLPIKDIYLYPLDKDFRELLCNKANTAI